MELFFMMLERGGLIILLAYLLVHVDYFKVALHTPQTRQHQWKLFLLFSLFTIISNYTGVEIQEDFQLVTQPFWKIDATSSIANTRVLSISVAGMVAGPVVSTAVGAVSAVVRYFQGGLAPSVYVTSSLLIGILSGCLGNYYLKRQGEIAVKQAAVIGGVLELVQMVCILFLSPQRQAAYALVQVIILPMVLINSLGVAVFVSIINASRHLEETTRAVQTHEVLELANKTLPYLRKGLTVDSCQPVAEIIHQYVQVAAVSMTNRSQILAFVGEGADHHIPNTDILTQLAKRSIESGQILIANSSEEVDCHHEKCPLVSAIVIPLKVKEDTLGTLKLYFSQERPMTFVDQQLASGLGNIFSTQLELGQAEAATRLLKDAEMKSLQAQVNPHFLFNALNTISALIRMDSQKARVLVQEFSQFLRGNLQGARKDKIPLKDELQHVEAYRVLEDARFPNKVKMTIIMQPEVEEDWLIPPFTLQVLVENAYKHAFKDKNKENQLEVKMYVRKEDFVLQVSDNGCGIPSEMLVTLGQQQQPSKKGTGSAIENLVKRLELLYGQSASIEFTSQEGHYTCVKLAIPIKEMKQEKTNENITSG